MVVGMSDDRICISKTALRALLDRIIDAVRKIDGEYPGHYSDLDPYIHLLSARLTGDDRDEMEILLEKERK